MGKAINNEDFIGKTFGKLKVISIGKKVGLSQYFNCECTCENHTKVEKKKTDLVTGKRLACKKCLMEEKSLNQVSDIIGKKIGKLTIESINRKDQKNLQYYYNCKCDCGHDTIKPRRVLLDALKDQNSTIQCEYCNKDDITNEIIGNTYGDFTIISFDHYNKYGVRFYKCRCSNNHEFVRERNDIINGSCRCDECYKNSKLETLQNLGSNSRSDSNSPKKVGKLEILSMFIDDNKQIKYHCLCECGRYIDRSRDYFLNIERENKNRPDEDKRIAMCDQCVLDLRLQKQINECIGKTYGRLYVEGLAELRDASNRPGEHEIIYKCRCTCGNDCNVPKRDLKSGVTVSCGCYNRERLLEANTKHGMHNDPFYHVHASLKDRCLNSNSHSYNNYGERGITVDPRWLGENGFNNFKEDMYDSYLEHKKLYPDDTSIDRIDNDGNYCKENCRWTTMKVQSNNQRKTVHLNYNDQDYTLSEFNEKFCPNLSSSTLYDRLERGGFINSENNKVITDKDLDNLTSLVDKRFKDDNHTVIKPIIRNVFIPLDR